MFFLGSVEINILHLLLDELVIVAVVLTEFHNYRFDFIEVDSKHQHQRAALLQDNADLAGHLIVRENHVVLLQVVDFLHDEQVGHQYPEVLALQQLVMRQQFLDVGLVF